MNMRAVFVERGKQAGIAEGNPQGQEEALRKTAHNLFEKIDPEMIAECTSDNPAS